MKSISEFIPVQNFKAKGWVPTVSGCLTFSCFGKNSGSKGDGRCYGSWKECVVLGKNLVNFPDDLLTREYYRRFKNKQNLVISFGKVNADDNSLIGVIAIFSPNHLKKSNDLNEYSFFANDILLRLDEVDDLNDKWKLLTETYYNLLKMYSEFYTFYKLNRNGCVTVSNDIENFFGGHVPDDYSSFRDVSYNSGVNKAPFRSSLYCLRERPNLCTELVNCCRVYFSEDFKRIVGDAELNQNHIDELSKFYCRQAFAEYVEHCFHSIKCFVHYHKHHKPHDDNQTNVYFTEYEPVHGEMTHVSTDDWMLKTIHKLHRTIIDRRRSLTLSDTIQTKGILSYFHSLNEIYGNIDANPDHSYHIDLLSNSSNVLSEQVAVEVNNLDRQILVYFVPVLVLVTANSAIFESMQGKIIGSLVAISFFTSWCLRNYGAEAKIIPLYKNVKYLFDIGILFKSKFIILIYIFLGLIMLFGGFYFILKAF